LTRRMCGKIKARGMPPGLTVQSLCPALCPVMFPAAGKIQAAFRLPRSPGMTEPDEAYFL
jgi:hypothetical protein